MNQQKVVQRFRDKVKGYLKSLCSASDVSENNAREGVEPIECKPVLRRKRLNFQLQAGLVKVTRKNVVLEEFQSQSLTLRLPSGLQRHVGSRIAHATTAVLHGNFTDEAAKTALFAVRVIAKQPSMRAHGNAVLAKGAASLRTREGCIDVLVRELRNDPIEAATLILTQKPAAAKDYVFVCHEELTPEDMRPLFKVSQGKYMIELQRIMALDKCIATIFYVSNCTQYLHIDSESLKQFLLAELAKVCPYAAQPQLDHVFTFLLERGYPAEVSTTIATFIENRRVDKGFQANFLKEIQGKHPQIGDALKQYGFQEMTQPQTSMEIGSIEDKTPLFGIRPRNSTFQHSLCEDYERKRRRSSAMFYTEQKGISTIMEINQE